MKVGMSDNWYVFVYQNPCQTHAKRMPTATIGKPWLVCQTLNPTRIGIYWYTTKPPLYW